MTVVGYYFDIFNYWFCNFFLEEQHVCLVTPQCSQVDFVIVSQGKGRAGTV